MDQNEEEQYLDIIRQVLSTGQHVLDRTNIGILSSFGKRMQFSLLDQRFPLLTTKKVDLKNILTELMWILSGSTDALELAKKGNKIWLANSDRKTLDKLGLQDYREYDCGPIYGFQMRHYGAKYISCDTDYTGQGVDQLANTIALLKSKDYSRRIVIDLWNAQDMPKQCLPACHCLIQFYVRNGKYLSCQMIQRSADMGLGVPYNIASYALFTILLANEVGLEPDKFIHVTGDTHVYVNHIDALKTQLERQPFTFPTLLLKNTNKSITEWTMEDIELQNYRHHSFLKMDMAV